MVLSARRRVPVSVVSGLRTTPGSVFSWGAEEDGDTMAGEVTMSSYRQLEVWKKSIDFTDHVYSATDTFPKSETYGLAGQMRRAAVSIASNIAEGSARHSKRDFARFLRQSRGSLAEMETQVTIAIRRAYLTADLANRLLAEGAQIGRMLSGLIDALTREESTAAAPQLETRYQEPKTKN